MLAPLQWHHCGHGVVDTGRGRIPTHVQTHFWRRVGRGRSGVVDTGRCIAKRIQNRAFGHSKPNPTHLEGFKALTRPRFSKFSCRNLLLKRPALQTASAQPSGSARLLLKGVGRGRSYMVERGPFVDSGHGTAIAAGQWGAPRQVHFMRRRIAVGLVFMLLVIVPPPRRDAKLRSAASRWGWCLCFWS
jgi:hypothetical protein